MFVTFPPVSLRLFRRKSKIRSGPERCVSKYSSVKFPQATQQTNSHLARSSPLRRGLALQTIPLLLCVVRRFKRCGGHQNLTQVIKGVLGLRFIDRWV